MIGNIFSLLTPIVLLIIGIYIFRSPAKTLLSWDRKTGYWIYKKHLKKTGNEEEAVAKAGRFYRDFGIIFIVFSSIALIFSFVSMINK